MLLKLRSKLAQRRSDASKILKAVADSPEARDMNPDEKAAFDKALSDIETLKTQIAQAREMEDEEDAEAASEEMPAEEPRSNISRPASTRRSTPIGEAPAVHTKKRPYSILRALRLASDRQTLDGLEGEISKEIERRSGNSPKGFFLPTGSDPELRALMYPGRRAETRDLTTTSGAGGIFNIPEMPLIDLLRAQLVTADLGATMLTDMHGVFAIPRQTGTASVYWLAEGSPATGATPSLDQVGFSPKVAIAATNISRLFMDQTSIDAETFVKNDLALTMARELDRVAINGSGGNQPTGIMQTTLVNTNSAGIQGGANGGIPTFKQIVGMESQVAQYNATGTRMAYLTNPALRGVLKTTPKIGTTFPVFLWDEVGNGVGAVNGYSARTTTNVPNNLTKGTSANNCSGLIFGDWSSLVIAQWEGVDIVVNPYTNQLAGAILVSMQMSVDVKLRHPESFAVISDATLS